MNAYTQSSSLGTGQRNVVDLTSRRVVFPLRVSEPWDVSLSGSTATFTDCIFQRQMLSIVCANATDGVLTGTVATTGTVYVGVEIDDTTGNGTIVTGAAWTDIADIVIPDDESKSKRPLYKFVNGQKVSDYRTLLNTGW